MDEILVNDIDNFIDTTDIVSPVDSGASESNEGTIDTVVPGSDILDSGVMADGLSDNTVTSGTLVYVDLDFFKDTLSNLCVPAFSLGFASATLLVLITYGVFKAFGLVRIKN